MTNVSKVTMTTFVDVNKPMKCRPTTNRKLNLMQEIMELFRAGDVNRPTMFLALASVAAACNRYQQATNTVLINGFYPEYRPLIFGKTQIICV